MHYQNIYESRISAVLIEEPDSSRQEDATVFFLCSTGVTVTNGVSRRGGG